MVPEYNPQIHGFALIYRLFNYQDKMDDDTCNDNGQSRKQLVEDETTDITGDDSGTSSNNTTMTKSIMAGEEEFAFRRRSALMRTPPAKRALSLPNEGKIKVAPLLGDTTPVPSEVEKDKRKRVEDSPPELIAREGQHKKQKEDKKNKETEREIMENPKKMIERSRGITRWTIGGDDKIITRVVSLMKRLDNETAVLKKLILENKNTKV